MRAPYEWLKELTGTRLTPEQLAERLTLAGSEVTRVEQSDGAAVLDLEITPNRADCLSIRGLAREVTAITGTKLQLPLVRGSGFGVRDERSRTPNAERRTSPRIRIADRAGCRQYIGRLITGITIAPSPTWLQRRLTACGIRPINNVVDVTNYVLLEWGQPLHAFDWSTLREGTIIVRRAQAGEKIAALDESARTLDASMLVIADAQRAVAIAGIVGGTETAVTNHTRDVLLESAQFDPRTIRLAARKLGLHSESSYRFERGIDPAGVELASRRAAQLIVELAGGQIVTRAAAGSAPKTPRAIAVTPAALAHRLGTPLPAARMKRQLAALGCRVAGSATSWRVTPPTSRPDLQQPADLLEEIARLTGYAHVAPVLPAITPHPMLPARDALRDAREQVRQHLIGCGVQEAVTWSLVPEQLVAWSGTPREQAVRITNPLSQEQAYLRPALWPRLLQCVATNIHRQQPGVRLFEIGNVHRKAADGSVQSAWHAAIVATGVHTRQWRTGTVPIDLFVVKEWLELLMKRLHLPPCSTRAFAAAPQPACADGQSATWTVGDTTAGFIGLLRPALATAVELRQPVIVAEWSLMPLLTAARTTHTYRPIPRTPSITRDLSVVVETQHAYTQLIQSIETAGGRHLITARLVDRYAKPPIPAGHVGLTFALEFRDPERTLTDADVDQAHAAIVAALAERHHAALRT